MASPEGFLDFVVIGAQKAGTSTLHAWLASDERIALPARKETHYFSSEDRRSRGWAWYADCFGDLSGSTLTGEVDPNYLTSASAAERIRHEIGDVKIIAVLRDPVARARSQYDMSVRRSQERRGLEEALEAELQARWKGEDVPHCCDYLGRGLYGEHLAVYSNLFSQILLVSYELLFDPASGPGEYAKILEFLGLDPRDAPDLSVRANAASVQKSSWLSELIWNKDFAPRVRRTVRRLLPSKDLRYRLSSVADRWNRTAASVDVIRREDLPPAAVELLVRDAERLEKRYGFATDVWRSPGQRNLD